MFTLYQWDTAGQERYRTITNAYYRGADGIILVYDLYKKQSFDNLRDWLQEVEKHASSNVSLIVVGNKNDRPDEREVKEEDVQKLIKETGIRVFEASAKEGTNVDKAFLSLTEELIEKNKST